MPHETLHLEKIDNVLVVTLNRPEKKNAISPKMAQELESLFHSLGHHGGGVRAMVITGGPGVFCAGLDLSAIDELSDHDAEHFFGDVNSLYLAMQETSVPIIAAIDGPAIAGGFDLAVMCDIRIATSKAIFGQPEIKVGVTQLIDPLWKIIGLGRAREMAMTGMIVDAQEAHRIGLVNRLVSSDDLQGMARELARELAEKDVAAMRATKQNLQMIPGMENIQALRSQMWIFQTFVDSREKRGRMASYLKKIKKDA